MSNECGSSTQKGWMTISSGKTEEEKNDRRNRKGEGDINGERHDLNRKSLWKCCYRIQITCYWIYPSMMMMRIYQTYRLIKKKNEMNQEMN